MKKKPEVVEHLGDAFLYKTKTGSGGTLPATFGLIKLLRTLFLTKTESNLCQKLLFGAFFRIPTRSWL
jgi:hypothetical protein